MSGLPDPRSIVIAGYDHVGGAYAAARPSQPQAPGLLGRLLAGLPATPKVLDAGCGAGVPVARLLVERCEVVGTDISPVQVELARGNVPKAKFAWTVSALPSPLSPNGV